MEFDEYEQQIIDQFIEKYQYQDIRESVITYIKDAKAKRVRREGYVEWRNKIRPEDIDAARKYLNTVEDWGDGYES